MTDKDKIIAEIERRIGKRNAVRAESRRVTEKQRVIWATQDDEDMWLLAFIKTLKEESTEDIR